MGESVDKQGIASGWTRGTVTGLCQNTVHYEGPALGDVRFLCDNKVEGARQGFGDSGAPVFNFQTPPPGSLYAYGRLYGGAGDAGYDTGDPWYSCTRGCVYRFSGVGMIQDTMQTYFLWYN